MHAHTQQKKKTHRNFDYAKSKMEIEKTKFEQNEGKNKYELTS